MSRSILTVALWVMSLCLFASPLAAQSTTRGVVYADRNGNQVMDPGEPPLEGVLVSNGLEIVKTDAEGRYELSLFGDMLISVLKPKGYDLPRDTDGIARAFATHKPMGSPTLRYPGSAPTPPLPQSLNFGLRPVEEPAKFSVVLFGDTQPYSQEQVDFLAQDIIPEVVGTSAAFGITLGDIVGDRLELFERVNEVTGRIGIPWHYVYGNHDMNFDAAHDDHADETFERVYGPTNTAFQYGPAHFVILDNVIFQPSEGNRRSGYVGGFDNEAMTFLKAYLKHVPTDAPLFIAFHIHLDDKNIDKKAFFEALKNHPKAVTMSAHTHVHRTLFFGAEEGFQGEGEHVHLNLLTTSGSWWGGAKDERGIPHTRMRDGAPNGWALLNVDGPHWSLDTKAAGAPWNYQMDLWYPAAVTREQLQTEELHVNVFNGNQRSRVEMRLNDRGPWVSLERTERVDPNYARLKADEDTTREAIVAWALKHFDQTFEAKDVATVRKDFEAKVRAESTKEASGAAAPETAVSQALAAFDQASKPLEMAALRASFAERLKARQALRELPVPNLPAPEVSLHLWANKLPSDLPAGAHRITVRTTNMFGRTYEAHRIVRILE